MHHPLHLHYSSYDTNVVSLYHRDILLLNTLKLNYIYQIIIIYMIYTEFFIIIDKYYTLISNFFLHCKMNFFQKSFPLFTYQYISFESFSQSAKHIYQQISRRVIIVESTNFVTIKNSNILSVNGKKKKEKKTCKIPIEYVMSASENNAIPCSDYIEYFSQLFNVVTRKQEFEVFRAEARVNFTNKTVLHDHWLASYTRGKFISPESKHIRTFWLVFQTGFQRKETEVEKLASSKRGFICVLFTSFV